MDYLKGIMEAIPKTDIITWEKEMTDLGIGSLKSGDYLRFFSFKITGGIDPSYHNNRFSRSLVAENLTGMLTFRYENHRIYCGFCIKNHPHQVVHNSGKYVLLAEGITRISSKRFLSEYDNFIMAFKNDDLRIKNLIKSCILHFNGVAVCWVCSKRRDDCCCH